MMVQRRFLIFMLQREELKIDEEWINQMIELL